MKMKKYKAVTMNEKDKVAVALTSIAKNTVTELSHQNKVVKIEVMDEIEFGHKFAIEPIKKGEDILKYGEVIGVASQNIKVGEHVHVHNLEGKRGRGDKLVK